MCRVRERLKAQRLIERAKDIDTNIKTYMTEEGMNEDSLFKDGEILENVAVEVLVN